jgi:DNA-directed RNA polymerase specialized sigma24 family protein
MSDNERKPPENDEDAPPSEKGSSPEDEDAPESGDRTPDDDDGPVEGDDPSAPPLDAAVVRAFLSSKKAWDVARAAIAKKVPAQEVEELVAQAMADAVIAPPPHVEAALVSWLYTIAERRVADWLRKRKRRQKYEGAMPTQAAREDDYTGEASEDESDGDAQGYDPETDHEPEDLLGDHLDQLVGDNAKDREVLGWLREHAVGKAYKAIAAERGLTEDQIASRIRRFKLKYEKPIKRRRQRMLILWLLGGAAVVAAAALVWWLLHREQHSYYKPLSAPSANATATSEPEGLPVSHPAPPDTEDGGD